VEEVLRGFSVLLLVCAVKAFKIGVWVSWCSEALRMGGSSVI
jgi:hypothetical protein